MGLVLSLFSHGDLWSGTRRAWLELGILSWRGHQHVKEGTNNLREHQLLRWGTNNLRWGTNNVWRGTILLSYILWCFGTDGGGSVKGPGYWPAEGICLIILYLLVDLQQHFFRQGRIRNDAFRSTFKPSAFENVIRYCQHGTPVQEDGGGGAEIHDIVKRTRVCLNYHSSNVLWEERTWQRIFNKAKVYGILVCFQTSSLRKVERNWVV